jgi:hypothetical protein
VAIRVYDAVNLPAEDLTVMQTTAEAALAPAGIGIRWTACPDGAPRPAACDRRRGGEIVVRIMPEHAPTAARCGFAVPGLDSGGFISIARVCAERAAEQLGRRRRTRSESVPVAQILGYILAHEIAHVLLPHSRHSSHGLFKARLGGREWALVRGGQLSFLPADIERLRVAGSAAARPLGAR